MALHIHPTAMVSGDAELDDEVQVGPYAIVEAGAKIGPGTQIAAQAYICGSAQIGAECLIHMFAVIGHAPQDFSYDGAPTKAILGDRVVVREHCTIHRSSKVDEPTVIGDDCYLMVGSHVAHNCHLGKRVILANGALMAGHVRVGDGANISGNVVIHQFVRIGKLSILSGGSRFGMDVPPFVIGDGTNSISALNSVGLRRSPVLTPEDRTQIKNAFKILYRSELAMPAALDRLRSEFDSPEVKHWVEVLSNPSSRGFCRYKPSRRHGD